MSADQHDVGAEQCYRLNLDVRYVGSTLPLFGSTSLNWCRNIMNGCVICKLVNNELPSWVVYEDEHVICFLPLQVEAYGHTVIAPKAHYADLFDTPTEALSYIFAVIQKISLHYRTTLGAVGINLLHASGIAAQQSVPHLHVHLIPRFENDGLDAWPKLPEIQYDKDALLKKMRL